MDDGLFRNSLDAVMWQHHVTDELAGRAASAIWHATMKSDAQDLLPEEPIDLLFLYAVGVKSLATFLGHTLLYPLPGVCKIKCARS